MVLFAGPVEFEVLPPKFAGGNNVVLTGNNVILPVPFVLFIVPFTLIEAFALLFEVFAMMVLPEVVFVELAKNRSFEARPFSESYLT